MTAGFRLSPDQARAEADRIERSGEMHGWRRSVEASRAIQAAHGRDINGRPLANEDEE